MQPDNDMAASLHCSSHPIGGFRRASAGVRARFLPFLTPRRRDFQPHVNLSFKEERVQVNKSWRPVSASNTNPSEGSEEDRKTSDAGQGPPFLTILAGLVVFLLVCWIIGSVVMWIVGLIVHLPPLK